MEQLGDEMRLSLLATLVSIFFLGIAAPVQAEKRVALVIGNSEYAKSAALKNPVNDAALMITNLEALGFSVTPVFNGDQQKMLDALSKFGRAARGADVALAFYAGHAVQVAGRNWLLPISSSIESEADLLSKAMRAGDIMDVMESAGASLKLMFLDACRDNPLPKTSTRSASRGLARIVSKEAGTMIAFATAPEQVALDGDSNNSPFTTALVQHITTPGLEIRQFMGRVRKTVYENTNKVQLPYVTDALLDEFYFAGRDPNAKTIPVAPPKPIPLATPRKIIIEEKESKTPSLSEKEAYALAEKIGTKGAWNAFLNQFPHGNYASFAKAARDKINAPVLKPQPPVASLTPPNIKHETSTGFLFPRSNSRLIRPEELRRLSRRELRIARNEIYARLGRYFNSADLKRHFSRFSWYRPYTWNPSLNRTERANVDLIKQFE